jgi:hypothetical protein
VSIIFHNNPFIPFDENEPDLHDSPSESSGNRRCVPIAQDFLPTAVDAARLRVGARPLPSHQWVSEIDDDWAPTLQMKQDLVARRPTEVIGAIGDVSEACDEVATYVFGSLGHTPTNESGLDALIDTALHVADDLCILVPDVNGIPRLSAGVVCAPNRWRLAEKLGGDMGNIHRPVARYDTDLHNPVRAMMARITVERPVWRVNWGISNCAALFQPDTPPATPEMDPGDLWFRVEWQTLRRLPLTGAILFTIRTYVEKMTEFMERDYAVVHEVADVINKIPEDVAVYKNIAPYRESLFAYLETR